MTGPRAPGRLVNALVAVAATVGLLLAGAAPASAHDRLVATDPADGSTVPQVPDELVLTFDEPAIALGTQVVVTGPDGAVVSQGGPELVDSTVTQALGGELPAGAYRVLWRVTSADGHPISGELAFSASGPTGTTATATPSAGPTAEPSSSVTAEPTDPAAAAVSDDGAGGAGGLPPWLVVLLVAAAGAGVGGVVLALGRTRRSR